MILAAVANRIDDVAFNWVPMTPLGIWFFGVNVLHLILVIGGMVKAGGGEVFRNRFQIPFFRRPYGGGDP